jgi:O-antigen ligase
MKSRLTSKLVGIFFHWPVAGARMQKRLDILFQAKETGGGRSIQIRAVMIKEGFAIIKSHPFLGVGLNHFRVYSSTGMYSHNNYTEVFCNTGIPGGILYYSVLIVLWLRLRWLSKLSLEDKVEKFVNVAKTFVIIQLVSDVAHVSHSIKFSWIIVAILIGFSYQLEQKIKGGMLTGYHESADEYQLQPECY